MDRMIKQFRIGVVIEDEKGLSVEYTTPVYSGDSLCVDHIKKQFDLCLMPTLREKLSEPVVSDQGPT
jgi:hypothetical protein